MGERASARVAGEGISSSRVGDGELPLRVVLWPPGMGITAGDQSKAVNNLRVTRAQIDGKQWTVKVNLNQETAMMRIVQFEMASGAFAHDEEGNDLVRARSALGRKEQSAEGCGQRGPRRGRGMGRQQATASQLATEGPSHETVDATDFPGLDYRDVLALRLAWYGLSGSYMGLEQTGTIF
jgi:hypothetical protein